MYKSFQLAIMITFLIAGQFALAQGQQEQVKPVAEEKADGKAEQKIDEAKRLDIIKMLDLAGAGKMGVQVVNQMITMQRTQNPNVPKEFWDEFMAEINPKDLIELSVPAYAKHFTHDDIKELIKFYESPVGKKLIEVQPAILQESMVAGQKWGMDLSQRIVERLQKEGF